MDKVPVKAEEEEKGIKSQAQFDAYYKNIDSKFQ